MFARIQLWIVLILCSMCCGQNLLHSQGFKVVAGEEHDGDFQVSTGVSIGLSGAKYTYGFSLVDENGFAYDTWSLLRNQQVVDHARLSDAQIESMGLIRQETEKKLIADFSKGFSSDEAKAEFEQIFLDAEVEMRSVMEEDQRARLEQAKHQLNLKQVGLAKFLAAPAMREPLGLKDSEIESLANSAAELETKSKRILQDVFRELNLQLIEELTKSQSASFDEFLGEGGKDEYLKQRLFSDNSPPKKIRKIPAPDFLRLIARSKKTREEIEVTTAQLDDIMALKSKRDAEPDKTKQRDIGNEIRKILSKQQYRKLDALTIQKEANRRGTVAALCGGSLGRYLDLSETEAQRLFEFGLKINQGLPARMRQATLKVWQETLGDISPAARDKVIEMMGEPVDFEKE